MEWLKKNQHHEINQKKKREWAYCLHPAKRKASVKHMMLMKDLNNEFKHKSYSCPRTRLTYSIHSLELIKQDLI